MSVNEAREARVKFLMSLEYINNTYKRGNTLVQMVMELEFFFFRKHVF